MNKRLFNLVKEADRRRHKRRRSLIDDWRQALGLLGGVGAGAVGSAALRQSVPLASEAPSHALLLPPYEGARLIRGAVAPSKRLPSFEDTGGALLHVGSTPDVWSHPSDVGSILPTSLADFKEKLQTAMADRPNKLIDLLYLEGHGRPGVQAVGAQLSSDTMPSPGFTITSPLGHKAFARFPLYRSWYAYPGEESLVSPKAFAESLEPYQVRNVLLAGCFAGRCPPELSSELAEHHGQQLAEALGAPTVASLGPTRGDIYRDIRIRQPERYGDIEVGRTDKGVRIFRPGEQSEVRRYPGRPDIFSTGREIKVPQWIEKLAPYGTWASLLGSVGSPLMPTFGSALTAAGVASAGTLPLLAREALASQALHQLNVPLGRQVAEQLWSSYGRLLPYAGLTALPLASVLAAKVMGRWRESADDKRRRKGLSNLSKKASLSGNHHMNNYVKLAQGDPREVKLPPPPKPTPPKSPPVQAATPAADVPKPPPGANVVASPGAGSPPTTTTPSTEQPTQPGITTPTSSAASLASSIVSGIPQMLGTAAQMRGGFLEALGAKGVGQMANRGAAFLAAPPGAKPWSWPSLTDMGQYAWSQAQNLLGDPARFAQLGAGMAPGLFRAAGSLGGPLGILGLHGIFNPETMQDLRSLLAGPTIKKANYGLDKIGSVGSVIGKLFRTGSKAKATPQLSVPAARPPLWKRPMVRTSVLSTVPTLAAIGVGRQAQQAQREIANLPFTPIPANLREKPLPEQYNVLRNAAEQKDILDRYSHWPLTVEMAYQERKPPESTYASQLNKLWDQMQKQQISPLPRRYRPEPGLRPGWGLPAAFASTKEQERE